MSIRAKGSGSDGNTRNIGQSAASKNDFDGFDGNSICTSTRSTGRTVKVCQERGELGKKYGRARPQSGWEIVAEA
jgi:hypothetical protein